MANSTARTLPLGQPLTQPTNIFAEIFLYKLIVRAVEESHTEPKATDHDLTFILFN